VDYHQQLKKPGQESHKATRDAAASSIVDTFYIANIIVICHAESE
jgi:hypothetical protein